MQERVKRFILLGNFIENDAILRHTFSGKDHLVIQSLIYKSRTEVHDLLRGGLTLGKEPKQILFETLKPLLNSCSIIFSFQVGYNNTLALRPKDRRNQAEMAIARVPSSQP
jgi:hypothetical protein